MKTINNKSMELTGLQKLTQNQLINIILRKDDLEKQLSAEVKKLHKASDWELLTITNLTFYS